MDELYCSYGFAVTNKNNAEVALYGWYYAEKNALTLAPQHAAVRIYGSWYESKLGPNVQITHRMEALEGPTYGHAGVRFYAR